MENEVAAIRRELQRLKATKMDVGPVDDIRVRDCGDGNAHFARTACDVSGDVGSQLDVNCS